MSFEGVMAHFDKAYGDIGAMVSNSFVVCEKVGKNEAEFHCTVALTKTIDMTVLDLSLESVNNLFERFNSSCCVKVIIYE